jgi:hypothetical protein
MLRDEGEINMLLSCSLRQNLTLQVSPVLRQQVGETSGDIPLYSLHRIKALLGKREMFVSKDLLVLLVQNLIAANQEYRSESGNRWNCLTSQNLVDAIETADREIAGAIDRIDDIPIEFAGTREKLFMKLHDAREQSVRTMQEWFETNFQDLLYSIDGKIPWPIVRRLQRNLGVWIATATNPFAENINDMVLSVAAEQGIRAGNAEDAWEDMGGTIFLGRKPRTE